MDLEVKSNEAEEMKTRPSNSDIQREEVIHQLERKRNDYLEHKNKALKARYLFGLIFLIMNLQAWFFRDYSENLLQWFNYISACGVEGQDCSHTLGVLRVSLGCFIFFSVMLVTTIRTKRLYDARSAWHSEWWALKVLLLIVSISVPFFFPSKYIQLYGEFARVGAGVFLVLQLVSIVEFINWWNNYWMPDDKEKQESCSFGLFMSTVFHTASVCGIVAMYFLYGRRLECSLNIFFITWTAVLLVVMMAISLHSMVNRGLLSSGIIASYLVFLCWSAIRRFGLFHQGLAACASASFEPANDICNKMDQANGKSDWTTILGFLIAIGAIVMATFSTGIDSQSFQFRKDKIRQEDEIPYDYGFFHLVFAFGAMYFAMLFLSWNLKSLARKWSIDQGWASTWVKIINEWFAATIYMWKLISPALKQHNRVMDHENSTQQTASTGLP